MRRFRRVILAGFMVAATSAVAGVRGPGRYNGIVHFDRWGGCYLHSGTYLMYLSEHAKSRLLPYAGQPIRMKALEVFQYSNPGDGLITKFKEVGPADETATSRAAEGMRLTAESSFASGSVSFRITATNAGATPLSLQADELSFTVLMKGRPTCPPGFDLVAVPGDGPSFALITRSPISWRDLGSAAATTGSSGASCDLKHAWHAAVPLPPTIELSPGASADALLTLEVPPGEFEFFLGHGGGVHAERSHASNSVAFDVDKSGAASVVP